MTISQTFENGLMVPQVAGALRIAQERRLLLADQPGSGKTAQALVGLELAGMFKRSSAILIMCNVTGCQLTWSVELRDRVATQYDVVIADLTDTGGKKTMPSVPARNKILGQKMIEARDLDLPLIVLANYDLARWRRGTPPKMTNLFHITFDAIIIDEAHLQLPTMKDAADDLTQFWFGLLNLQRADNPILLSMTGSPDRGKLWNRYGHWKFLWSEVFRDFWTWARQNFVVTAGEWGGAEIGPMRYPDQWRAMDARHMLRRTKAEIWEGMPEKMWPGDGGIDLPMTFEQQAAYDDYMDEMEAKLEELLATGQEEDARRAQGLKLQFGLRSRQMATCTWDFIETTGTDGKIHIKGKPRVAGIEHSNKLAWLQEWLSNRGYVAGEDFSFEGGKVVIVSFFTEVLHWLQAELVGLGIQSAILAGDTDAPERQRVQAEFQHGDLRVVLLSGYLGVSINLDAADDMIFVDSVHDPDKMEQAEDRIHRASRFHHAFYWRLSSIGTADMVVLQVIDTRYRETRATYEGNRGVQFARRMLGLDERIAA